MEITTQPNISDPLLVPRVQKYLESNIDKTYVDIIKMADSLQGEYIEYARLKRNPFRLIVRKAYALVMQNYRIQDNNASSTDEDADSDDSVQETTVIANDNQELSGLFYKIAEKPIESTTPLVDDELIDISSDNSGDESPNSNGNNDPKINIVPQQQHPVQQQPQPPAITKSILFSDTVVGQPSNDAKKTQSDEIGKKRKVDYSGSGGGGGGGGKFPPTNKKRKLTYDMFQPNITFKDIGGMDKTVQQICKLFIHIRHPEIYTHLGITPPRGFLLHGPPGCGKTFLVHAIAGEFGIPLLKVAATELVGGISGESEERIRELFDCVVNSTPCILFIDEIDAVTPNRQHTQKDMERRIVAQLLSCLDGLSSHENGCKVMVIGATNRPEAIDPALRRAGRFDQEIAIGIPDVNARKDILKIITSNLKTDVDLDCEQLAKYTPGYVAADLVALIREAAIEALNRSFDGKPLIDANVNPIEKNVINIDDDNVKKTSNEPEVKENTISMNNNISKDDKNDENALSDITTTENNTSDDMIHLLSESPPIKKPQQILCIQQDVILTYSNDKSVEGKTLSPMSSNQSVTVDNLSKWLHQGSPIPKEQLNRLVVTMADLKRALKTVQPSAKREGFATVPDVTWDDVGSLKAVREELQMSILGPIRHSKQFEELGLTPCTGVLLCGPPGCGKTLMAKAIANEASINFISVKGPELLNMYVGESERAVRVCFERAKNSAPCVIFFDEFDAICPKRADSRENGSTMRVVNQMLTEMDGMETRTGVFVLAATNRPDIIDPAILRPGRLDKTIFVNLPSGTDRADILRALTKNGTRPRLAVDVDLDAIGKSTLCQGFTGADLNALIKEAGIVALKEFVNIEKNCSDQPISINGDHFAKALTRVKPSVSPTDQKYYTEMMSRYTNIKDSVEEMECS